MSIFEILKKDRVKEATAASDSHFQVKEHGGEI